MTGLTSLYFAKNFLRLTGVPPLRLRPFTGKPPSNELCTPGKSSAQPLSDAPTPQHPAHPTRTSMQPPTAKEQPREAILSAPKCPVDYIWCIFFGSQEKQYWGRWEPTASLWPLLGNWSPAESVKPACFRYELGVHSLEEPRVFSAKEQWLPAEDKTTGNPLPHTPKHACCIHS